MVSAALVIATVGGAGVVIVLLSVAAAPLRVSSAPLRVAPAAIETAAFPMIMPLNDDVAPVDTAPATCQKTLYALVPLIRLIWVAAAVLRAPPIWKMKTASGSPNPSSVMVPPLSETAAAPEL